MLITEKGLSKVTLEAETMYDLMVIQTILDNKKNIDYLTNLILNNEQTGKD